MNPQAPADVSLGDGLADRLLHLLSDNVFTIGGIMFVSMAAACGLVSIINQHRGDPNDGDEAHVREFNRVSRGLAQAFGFLFAGMGVYGYLAGGLAERAYLTLMIALIAGGFTPALYDAFWWARETALPAAGAAVVEFFKKYGAKALSAVVAMVTKRKPPQDPPKE